MKNTSQKVAQPVVKRNKQSFQQLSEPTKKVPLTDSEAAKELLASQIANALLDYLEYQKKKR